MTTDEVYFVAKYRGWVAMWRMILLLIFFVPITACASYSLEARHEAFKTMYGSQVGLKADDPDNSWLARYPQNVIARHRLPNGNIEIEYRARTAVRGCRVFYELQANSRVIVGWRFKGSEEDCTWVP